MKIYSTPEHPLRAYLEDEIQGEVNYLTKVLDNKYSPDESQYQVNTEEELTSLIFKDSEGKSYIVHGLISVIIQEATNVGITCNNEVPIVDLTREYPEIDENLLDGIQLRPYQSEGIAACLGIHKGIIQVHTGGGKTEMMIGVTKYLLENSDMNILICVPTTKLLYQTLERATERGLSENDISLLGAGNKLEDTSKRVCIATVASAYKKLDEDENYMDWLSNVQCLMMDEAHHSKCRTWSTLIDRVSPEYLLGFTAEPFHKDKDHMVDDLVLRGLLGPVIHRVTMDYLVEHGYLAKPYVIALDSKFQGNMFNVMNWQTVNKHCLVTNTLRNNLIKDIAVLSINQDKKPLILVQQISHGQELARMISTEGYKVYMMTGNQDLRIYSGGTDIEHFTDTENRILKDFEDGKVDAIIGTSALDEGVDIPSLGSVILAGGGKGRLKVIQRIGRAIRKKSGDNTAYVFDFRDRFNVITQSHYRKREAMYKDLGMDVYYLNEFKDIVSFIQSIKLGQH